MNDRGKVGRGKVLLFLLMGLVVGLFISAGFDLTGTLQGLWGKKEAPEEQKVGEQAASAPAANEPADSGTICLPDFGKLAQRADPTVVNISTTQTISRPEMFRGFRFRGPGGDQFGQGERNPFEDFFDWFGVPQEGMKRRSLGSGFVIEKDGYILTNNHVVQGADSITVVFWDEKEKNAKVIGKDPKTDIALIKVEAEGDMPVATLGDSDALEVGDWVLAIGNPFGLKYTLTAGIVSAKGREIGAGPYDDFIQTDASINPGNSGGPLMDLKGQVVGVNSAIVAGGTGIGFAIPINMVKQLLPQLREKGRVSRGWLGVYIQRVTPDLAKSFGLEKANGALVSEVSKDGPAAGSGLEHGDIIVAYEGKPIENFNDLPRMVAMTPPGTKVEVKALRKGKEKTFQIVLGELPAEEGAAPEAEGESGGELGLELQEITPDLARSHNLPADQGLLVTNATGIAAEAGLRRGDVILEINQRPVKTIAEFRETVRKTGKGSTMLFLIKRQEGALYIPVEKQ